jgi:hypothetical protein
VPGPDVDVAAAALASNPTSTPRQPLASNPDVDAVAEAPAPEAPARAAQHDSSLRRLLPVSRMRYAALGALLAIVGGIVAIVMVRRELAARGHADDTARASALVDGASVEPALTADGAPDEVMELVIAMPGSVMVEHLFR